MDDLIRLAALADEIYNDALDCDRKGLQDMATANLEITLALMQQIGKELADADADADGSDVFDHPDRLESLSAGRERRGRGGRAARRRLRAGSRG